MCAHRVGVCHGIGHGVGVSVCGRDIYVDPNVDHDHHVQHQLRHQQGERQKREQAWRRKSDIECPNDANLGVVKNLAAGEGASRPQLDIFRYTTGLPPLFSPFGQGKLFFYPLPPPGRPLAGQ